MLLFALVWCSRESVVDTRDQEIVVLKETIEKLKWENTRLQSENALVKSAINSSTTTATYWTEGDGFVYSESNYSSCLKDAHDGYIGAWTELCIQAGFSTGEILANKCDLDTPAITNLQKIKSDAEAECKNLYQ
jgi:hypothetical protein